MDTSQPTFSSSPEGHCCCVLLPGGQTESAPGEGSLSWLGTRLCSPAPGRVDVMEEKEPSVACGGRDGLQETRLPSVAPSPAPALGESVRASPPAGICFRIRLWQATRCPGQRQEEARPPGLLSQGPTGRWAQGSPGAGWGRRADNPDSQVLLCRHWPSGLCVLPGCAGLHQQCRL